MEYEKKMHSGKTRCYLQGTSSEVAGSGTDIRKPEVEEHLTFGKLSDNATTFLMTRCFFSPPQ